MEFHVYSTYLLCISKSSATPTMLNNKKNFTSMTRTAEGSKQIQSSTQEPEGMLYSETLELPARYTGARRREVSCLAARRGSDC